jgi:uncharacterized damage-inducible protein DinB
MNPQALIHQLTELLTKGNAHVPFEEAIAGLPAKLRGVKPDNMPYSIWQLVEHIRIAQWDILKFSEGPGHQSPEWPGGYWPDAGAPADEAAWKQALQQTEADKQAFIQLLHNRQYQLLEPFPYGDGQNLLREALLIADHTSYHTGQIVLLRRLLGNWQA